MQDTTQKNEARLESLTFSVNVPRDEPEILAVHLAAFPGRSADRSEVADLTRDLLADESATPVVSILARSDETPVGHILFTRARLVDASPSPSVYILAPLGVVPPYQKQGVGTALIRRGLAIMKEMDVKLVFVLGHIAYYPRTGFVPAFPLGFLAPYPIPKEVEDAWMVQALTPEGYGDIRGEVMCADAMNQPQHWRE